MDRTKGPSFILVMDVTNYVLDKSNDTLAHRDAMKIF